MKPTINIDSTNDIANIHLQIPELGAYVSVNQLKMGETAHMTLNQADAHARALARQALHAAIAAL